MTTQRTLPWVLGLTLLFAACGGEPAQRAGPAAGPPVAVELALAAAESWPEVLDVTATVQPLRRATPGTLILGRVDAVHVREGDVVRRGQVLAEVESREVRARLAQARAAVAAAAAQEQNAALTRDRMQRLFDRQASSRRNLDDALAGYAGAAAAVQVAEEGVKAAEMYVAYSRITAPFDGVVVDKFVEAGDTASPGAPLFAIEDVAQVQIEAHVAESAAAAIALGQAVEAEIQGATYRGEVREIVPAADAQSRTVTVRARIDNPERRLHSGMFARLRAERGRREVLAVPTGAVVRRGPLAGVFVVDDGNRARLRWITLGSVRDERVEVLTGLDPGARYVVRPPAGLADGGAVTEVRG